jgi:hypothetical protein
MHPTAACNRRIALLVCQPPDDPRAPSSQQRSRFHTVEKEDDVMMLRLRLGGLFVIAAALSCGCTRSGPVKISELPVTGKVTLGGQPVAGATVMFQSDITLATFTGVTSEDGSYRLGTAEQRASDCKGACRVSISKFLKPDGSPLGPDEVPFVVGAVESLPQVTSTLETTTLRVDVPEGGDKFDFALVKQ